MSLGDTLLQLLLHFIVSTVYGVYLPRSYVGFDGLLRHYYYYYYYFLFTATCKISHSTRCISATNLAYEGVNTLTKLITSLKQIL